mmetsp:Transcript_52050/g.161854  ORF Transcript_52050/g.161854 Transcript_52050/m.161854 type:complete len:217 (+) Transcript_52050:1360-2010(+)
MPVIGNENDILAIGVSAERKLLGCSHCSSAEHSEPELIVLVVLAPLGTIELLLGQSPNLLQEERMVNKHAVDTLLEGVEEADGGGGVPQRNFSGKLSVPGIVVLIVAGSNGHHTMSQLGKGARKTVTNRSESSSHRPRGDLSRHEHNLKLLVGNNGIGTGTTTEGHAKILASHEVTGHLAATLGHVGFWIPILVILTLALLGQAECTASERWDSVG